MALVPALAMSIVLCEPTSLGLTLLVAPAPGPITVEAWVGGGLSDERAGQGGLAHLAEHVALAAAERSSQAAPLLRAGGGLDGRVTPDATVFRALAPSGASGSFGAALDAHEVSDVLGAALSALAAVVAPASAPADLVLSESARIADEDAALSPHARAVATLWRRAPAPALATTAAVERWWHTHYRPSRITLAIRGASPAAARRALAATWPSRRALRAAPPLAPSERLRRELRSGQPDFREPRTWLAAARFDRIGVDDLAALVVAAAAAGIDDAVAGDGACSWTDVVLARSTALWLIAVDDAAHSHATLADRMRRLARLDDATLAQARAAAWLPLPGVDGPLGELAYGQHVHGDAARAARLRERIDAVTPDEVARVVHTHLARRVRVASRTRPLAPPRRVASPTRPRPMRVASPARSRSPSSVAPTSSSPAPVPSSTVTPAAGATEIVVRRATLPGGTRVVAARIPGETEVAIRVAWDAGFGDEPADLRGIVNLVAASSVVRCAARDSAAEASALGGALASVAGRWSAGVRGRWPTATWPEGLALVVDCATRPSLDRATVAGEQARLIALSRGVAASPARNAFLAFLATRWGAHPLARAPLAPASALAMLDRAAVEDWWRTRHPIDEAVIVIAGDIDPDAAIAAVRARVTASPPSGKRTSREMPARAGEPRLLPPPLPAKRQIFVDGPAGTDAAIVVGLPGLAADHADRALLDGLAALLADPRGRLRAVTALAGTRAMRVAVVDGPDTGYVAIELEGVARADDALTAVELTLRAIVTDGPTADELAIAQAALAAPPAAAWHADRLAHAELRGAAPAPTTAPAVDAAALQRLAGELLRWDDAIIATVRPADVTPGARKRATKKVPARRSSRPRRGARR